MTRKPQQPPMPDTVRDEILTVAHGECQYELLLDDATVEVLAQGICPEHIARAAYGMLLWKREHYRRLAQEDAAGRSL